MIIVALGANLPSRFGTPPETLAAAVKALDASGLAVLRLSGVWRTAPVPVCDQPWYYNQAAIVDSEASPREILNRLQKIEESFGRTRTFRNEPRILDLDLIAVNGEIIDEPGIAVPHPRMHERRFVLGPLAEIAPGWKHPATGCAIGDLLAGLPAEQEGERLDA